MIRKSRSTRRPIPGAIFFLLVLAPTPLWAQCGGSTRDLSTATQPRSIAVTAASTASDCRPPSLLADELLLHALPSDHALSPSDFLTVSHATAVGPSGTEKMHSIRSDWGNSALSLIGYRIRSSSTQEHDANLIAGYDRSAFWGGTLKYDVAVGKRDVVGLGFESGIGRQRSAFTPQMAHRYSSQSLGAMISWQHDQSFGLAAAVRSNRISTAASPWERQAARAAGSPLEAGGVHLTASFFPFADQNGDERPDRLSLTLDAYHQRLSPQEAAIFSADGCRRGNGAMLAVKLKF